MNIKTYIEYHGEVGKQREAIQPAIDHARLWPVRQEYDKELRQAKHALGRVAFSKHQSLPLALYCYQKSATFRTMTPTEMFLRGVLIELGTGRIIAWPFGKMGNWSPEEIPSNTRVLTSQEKADGSLIIASLYNDEVIFTTKGGFNGVWVDDAYKIYHALPQASRESFREKLRGHTAMFEIITPNHQQKVKYFNTKPELAPLWVRDNNTGVLSIPTMNDFYYFDKPRDFDFQYLYQVREAAESLTNENFEGYVVTVDIDGKVVPFKVKTKWYLAQTANGRPVGAKDFLLYALQSGHDLDSYLDSRDIDDPENHPMTNELAEAAFYVGLYTYDYEQAWGEIVKRQIAIENLSEWLKENFSPNKKTYAPFFEMMRGKVSPDNAYRHWRDAAIKKVLNERY